MSATNLASSTASPDRARHARLAVFLAVAGALAAVAVLPYLTALSPSLVARIPVPLPVFVIAQFLQSGAMLLLLSWLGLRLGQSIALDAPVTRAFVYRRPMSFAVKRPLAIACIAGVLTGAVVLVLDKVSRPFMPAMTLPAPASAGIDLWKRLLASFYGGITEELIARLFLMTLIVWLIGKIAFKRRRQPSKPAIWIGILGAAILFGLGHLPATAAVWPLTPLVVARTVLLNALAGTAFGFIYWGWGLELAMCAHFCADIVVHVIGGS
jgi:hypothetical protein